ncbi:protein obstructor-E-like [Penaeus indicus]|uniref:protein obstructor-E-like n=1 Tax=Penaeus indicus TaxID=29960 RepID=UPI00300D54A6
MGLEWAVFVLLVVAGSGRAQSVASECPTPNGFFADAEQCDKYYHCLDNVLTEKVCPDGMAFNDLNPKVEKCDFLFQVNCEGRPKLQNAKPSENCPRQNGYFPHPESTNCHQFYYCTGGQSSQLTCPEGLSFSVKSGTCVWPDQAGRSNCVSEKLLNFTCPALPPSSTEVHPRFADPDDCQYFYVCINGKEPRRNGCAFGQVFNNLTKTCDAPKDVPECKDYYTEYFDNYFSTLNAEQGGRVSTDVIAAAIASGYPVPRHRNRVHVQPGQATQGDAPLRLAVEEEEGPEAPRRPATPVRRRRPGGGVRRRGRPRTTTTTTTTTPEPDYYYYYDDDYYNDENYPEEAAPDTAPANPPSVTRNTLPILSRN